MKKGFLGNLIIALIFGLLIFIVPIFFLKAVFAVLAIIFLGINMKNDKIPFLILALIFFVIPVVIFSSINSSDFSWSFFWNEGFKPKTSESLVLEPDTYIDKAENLIIESVGLEIVFDETSDQIYIPHQIKQQRNGSTLRLYSEYSDIKNQKVKIIVGTKNPYHNIQINSTSLYLNGKLNTEYFYADTTSLKVNADIYSDYFDVDTTSFSLNKDLNALGVEIDATSIYIRANIFAKDLDIDGTSINLQGFINSEKIRIDGTTVKIDLEVEDANNINISGTTINAVVKYEDIWQGNRYLRVEATHGDLKIIEPSSNTGRLEVRTEGRIRVDREK